MTSKDSEIKSAQDKAHYPVSFQQDKLENIFGNQEARVSWDDGSSSSSDQESVEI